MSTLQMGLLSLGAVLLMVWWSLRRVRAVRERKVAERIDTLMGWPPQATRLLTTEERIAFGTLIRAVPEFMVLAQVPLARFLSVPKRNSYADWLRRVGYQCVDFVVCDMASQVVAVVEVQAVDATERARKRLARMSRTLKAADIPVHVWNESALPSADAAREAILPKPQKTTATPVAKAARVLTLVEPSSPPPNPFDDMSRDSTYDELIELLEPPPTWFDDMDTEPAPLRRK